MKNLASMNKGFLKINFKMFCKGHSPQPFFTYLPFHLQYIYRPTADTGNSEEHPTGKNTQKYREI